MSYGISRRRLASLVAALGMATSIGMAAADEKVQGVTDDTIRIGMHNSLSGPLANLGLAYKHAYEIVFEKVNAAGGINGRKIEFIAEDDRGDAAAGVSAVQKLLDRDKVFMVLSGAYTPVALAVYPRVISRGLIYFAGAAGAPALTKPLKPLVFQTQLTLDLHGAAVVKLATSMKPKKIAFINENSEYGKVTQGITVNELSKVGRKIDIEESIDPNPTSATAQVLSIKDQGADVIIYGGTQKALAVIIPELYKQGVKAPLLAYGGGHTAALFNIVTSSAPIEYYAVSPLACRLVDPCAAEFMREWKAHFPDEAPIVWAAHGYATIQMLVEALRLAGRDLTTEKLVQTLETMPEFSNPLIAYPMKVTHENHRAMQGGFLQGFKNGKPFFFGDEIK